MHAEVDTPEKETNTDTITSPAPDTIDASDPPPGFWAVRGWRDGLAFGSAAGVVGLACAFGSWDRTFREPTLDTLFAGLAGVAFLMLFDGMVALLRLLSVGVLRLAGRDVSRLRAMRTSRLSFPLAALWFCFAWRVVPEGSPLGFLRAGALGTLAIGTVMVGGALVGGAVGRSSRRALYATALLPIAVVGWLAWPGPGTSKPERPGVRVTQSALADPGAPGTYDVEQWSYGSGTDRHRREYSSDALIETAAVDGTGIWDPPGGVIGAWWRGISGASVDALPLQALVWQPVRQDPAPLVLIVHGNHASGQPSDPGYDYLGDHLASRGYIVASLDENFLNGSALFEPGGSEMALRSWLITEHIALWQRWNDDPESPLYGRIDLDHVVLAGHSRGGEAAAHAAGMLERQCPPVAGRVAEGLADVHVVGVVSIAPSDGQWQPCGGKQTLASTSYLTISGGHDADTEQFFGLAQYSRSRPEIGSFKAAVYIHRANHGQFNAGWGYGDLGGFDWLLLDRASLLTAEEQQRAAKAVIGAFIEATAGERREYELVFREPDAAASWLPEDAVVTRYRAGGTHVIDDSTAATGAGRAQSGFDVAESVILQLPVDGYPQSETARHLTWAPGGHPAVSYSFDPVALTATGAVTLELTAAGDSPLHGVVVRITDSRRNSAVAALDSVTAYRQPLERHVLKWPTFARLLGVDSSAAAPEDVLQTYIVPLDEFAPGEGAIDASAIVGLEVLFDGAAPGDVYLDGVGFLESVTR